jgi:hypothetical protein
VTRDRNMAALLSALRSVGLFLASPFARRKRPLPRTTGELELGKGVTVGAELALDTLTCDDVSVQMLTVHTRRRGLASGPHHRPR